VTTNQHNRDGFTLIELLIVSAILAILATLLLPTLTSAMRRARQIHCVNNVRQLGIGLHEFVSDRHVYPLLGDAGKDENGGRIYWINTLVSQLGDNNMNNVSFWNQGILRCPAVQSEGAMGDRFLSYGYNAFGLGTNVDALGLGGRFAAEHRPFVKEGDIVNPGEMMALGDGFDGDASQLFSGHGLFWRHRSSWGTEKPIADVRHQGKANVVFCDGHGESPTLQSLFTDTNDSALVRWNRDHQPHGERSQP
jgi:prepilin-type N-terminal cleavage/methylation domain-containing protein/prepilin-type processing-associated H-X9-DG protein